MPISRLDSMVSFTPGYKKLWRDENQPVPDGVYIYDTEAKVIKIGNGVDLFADLPVWLDAKDITLNAENRDVDLSMIGDITIPDDVGDIIIASSEGTYITSGIKLQDIINSMANINNINSNQDDDLNNLNSKAIEIDHAFASGEANSLNTIQSNKIVPLGLTPDQNKDNVLISVEALAFNITDIKFYSDAGLTNMVTELTDPSITYYAVIEYDNGLNNTINSFGLICDDSNPIIQQVNDNVFSIDVNTVTTNENAIFTGSAFDVNTATTKSFDKSIAFNLYFAYFTLINSSQTDAHFSKIIVDSDGNYVATGASKNNSGYYEALFCKFDPSLNLINKRLYGETGNIKPTSIDQDEYGNYAVCGYEDITLSGHNCGFILKLDVDFNIISTKTFSISTLDSSGNYPDTYFNIIKVDHSDNSYIIGGYSHSVHSSNCVFVKYDNDLNIIFNTYYNNDYYVIIKSIIIDSDGNYIAIGYTNRNRTNGQPLLWIKIKPTDGSILIQNSYGNGSYYNFIGYSIDEDANGNYIIAGHTDGANYHEGSIVFTVNKTDLSVVNNIIYSYSNNSYCTSRAVKVFNDKLIICGLMDNSINGANNAFYSVLNSDLTIDTYEGLGDFINNSRLYGLDIDNGNSICVGSTYENHQGYTAPIIIKFIAPIPTGEFDSLAVDYKIKTVISNMQQFIDPLSKLSPALSAKALAASKEILSLNDIDTTNIIGIDYDTFPTSYIPQV